MSLGCSKVLAGAVVISTLVERIRFQAHVALGRLSWAVAWRHWFLSTWAFPLSSSWEGRSLSFSQFYYNSITLRRWVLILVAPFTGSVCPLGLNKFTDLQLLLLIVLIRHPHLSCFRGVPPLPKEIPTQTPLSSGKGIYWTCFLLLSWFSHLTGM